MNCPRCSSHLADGVAVTDTPNGIVVVVSEAVATERRHCICGWTWTIASMRTTVRQPHLALVQGAA